MPVTYSRDLPDPAPLVLEVLRQCGAGASTTQPVDIAARGPWFVAYRFGGAAPHPKFLDRATFQVQAFAATDVDAERLAATGRTLLYRAWRSQFSSANGVIHRVDEVSAPFSLPSGVDNVWRYDATYSVWVRPAH